jgi:adenylate cyclase
MADDPPPSDSRPRRPIVLRLLAAFLAVSLLPIAILGYLSWRESRGDGGHVEGEPAAAETQSGERLLGAPIASIELGVAGASLAISALMALYVGRTLVRPIRSLEGAMARVEAGDLDATAPVSSDDEIGRLAASFNRMVVSLKREAFIRDLFGQYVTPELANVAIEGRGKLDGQLVTSTILFSDIRNFTGFSEELPASSLIEMLNRYFDRMAGVVVEHGGLVNKYGGDSLLAVFGTPLNPSTDHASRAVAAALEMEQALAEFNREQAAAYLPEIMVGIGIATGDVIAGNVGSERKLEYTVVGDAVNVASRLQSLTKDLGRPILANAETARAAPAAAVFVDVGQVEVRGRAHEVRIFAVEEPTADGNTS